MELEFRPRSVQELSKQAEAFDYSTNHTLKRWIGTARILAQQARSDLQDGNFQRAYWLFLRHSILVIDKLPSHPEAKTAEGKKALRSLNKGLREVMEHLERIRPIVRREFEEWQELQSTRPGSTPHEHEDRQPTRTKYEEHALRDPNFTHKTRLLDASENQELAVSLAQQELKTRDVTRKRTRSSAMTAEEEQSRRVAGLWDNWSNKLAEKQARDEELFRRQMESTTRQTPTTEPSHIEEFVRRLDRAERDRQGTTAVTPSRTDDPYESVHYRYPSIAKSEPLSYDAAPPAKLRKQQPQSPRQPPRPPKDLLQEQRDRAEPGWKMPELPAKEPLYDSSYGRPSSPQVAPIPPPKVSELALPSPTVKSQRLTFKPAAYLENGDSLRSMFLPAQLQHRFVALASNHTRKGVEMCGILCGTAVNNALFVTCLLIPEQKCTPDTCEMENEEAMLDYCMKEDLFVLGWIHTHPTQTCFMSSRDLHTQSGFQVMMPESVAIVCSPKHKPNFGTFRLTDPPGLPHVLACEQTATFHQHSIDGLYTDAEQPAGHVFESDNLDWYVHDLRPGAKNDPPPSSTRQGGNI